MTPTSARTAIVTARIGAFKTSASAVKRSQSSGPQAEKPYLAHSSTFRRKLLNARRKVEAQKPTMDPIQNQDPLPRAAAKGHYVGSPLLKWFQLSAQVAVARDGVRPQPTLISRNASQPKSQPAKVIAKQEDLNLDELLDTPLSADEKVEPSLDTIDALLAGYESVAEYKKAARN